MVYLVQHLEILHLDVLLVTRALDPALAQQVSQLVSAVSTHTLDGVWMTYDLGV